MEEFELFCKSIGLTYEPESKVYRNKGYGGQFEWGCVFTGKLFYVNGTDFNSFKEFKEYTINLLKITKEKYKEEKIKTIEEDF